MDNPLSGTIVQLPEGHYALLKTGLKLQGGQDDLEQQMVTVYLITDPETCNPWINPQTGYQYTHRCRLLDLTEVKGKNDLDDNFPDGNGKYIPKEKE